MKTIQLTQGKVALVDDDDYERLNQFKWHCYKDNNVWYAIRNVGKPPNRTTQHMHREILRLKKGDPDVDHRDRDGLNNQRSNLRFATDSQNIANSPCRSASGYKGVYLFRDHKVKPWCAVITRNRKRILIGFFVTAKEAAIAWNKKALELFGDFARLNSV